MKQMLACPFPLRAPYWIVKKTHGPRGLRFGLVCRLWPPSPQPHRGCFRATSKWTFMDTIITYVLQHIFYGTIVTNPNGRKLAISFGHIWKLSVVVNTVVCRAAWGTDLTSLRVVVQRCPAVPTEANTQPGTTRFRSASSNTGKNRLLCLHDTKQQTTWSFMQWALHLILTYDGIVATKLQQLSTCR